MQPGIIAVALVENDNRAFGEAQAARAGHVGDTALGDERKGRQRAVVIETEMQLHRRLAKRVMRPGEDLEREVDERGVERIELVLEAEAVARRMRQATGIKPFKQRGVELRRLLLVDARERAARHRACAQMIKARGLCFEIGDDVAQAVSAAQMPGGERHELRPARHPPQRGARMVRIGERVEFVSRDQPKKLTEDRAMIGQGLVPRCGSMVSRNSIVPSYERTKPLLLQSLWDSSDSDPNSKAHPAGAESTSSNLTPLSEPNFVQISLTCILRSAPYRGQSPSLRPDTCTGVGGTPSRFYMLCIQIVGETHCIPDRREEDIRGPCFGKNQHRISASNRRYEIFHVRSYTVGRNRYLY